MSTNIKRKNIGIDRMREKIITKNPRKDKNSKNLKLKKDKNLYKNKKVKANILNDKEKVSSNKEAHRIAVIEKMISFKAEKKKGEIRKEYQNLMIIKITRGMTENLNDGIIIEIIIKMIEGMTGRMTGEMIEGMIEGATGIREEMTRDQTGNDKTNSKTTDSGLTALQKVMKVICHRILRKWTNLTE